MRHRFSRTHPNRMFLNQTAETLNRRRSSAFHLGLVAVSWGRRRATTAPSNVGEIHPTGPLAWPKGGLMDTTTLLIIILIIVLLFGGGFYGRGRWW